MKEKTTNESMQETEEKRELDKELEEKEKDKRTTWVCTLKKFLKFDALGHEPEKQAVHYRTPYSPWLLTHTHTHSGFVISRIRRNPRGRRFLISKYFANIKRLKISARSTTCRTVRTQDRTDLASSSVNRSATWGHAHVLTMHTKRQQTKKKEEMCFIFDISILKMWMLIWGGTDETESAVKTWFVFHLPRFIMTVLYLLTLSAFALFFLLEIKFFSFFLSRLCCLPMRCISSSFQVSPPLLWQPFRWGGRVGVAGWKVGDAPRKRWKGGELLVPPFLFIFCL